MDKLSLDEYLTRLNAWCSDGSCVFRPKSLKGMVTNGGCKCCKYGDKALETERLIRWMRAKVDG